MAHPGCLWRTPGASGPRVPLAHPGTKKDLPMTGRTRWLALCLAVAAAPGCTLSGDALRYVILPEQRTIAVADPAPLPPVEVPPLPPPRTVSEPQARAGTWPMSLDEAIRVALDNANVVRVLAGITAVTSGSTIYDTAIAVTAIDQEQARFDPVFSARENWNRIETPAGSVDPVDPSRGRITGTSAEDFRSDVRLNKVNVLGGQWGLTWVEDPTRFGGGTFLLNPQNRSSLELNYTQPLLQGAGFYVNTAPIVLARLDTERSYFQFKDSVQE